MKNFIGFIYMIENKINDKIYVGQTVDPYKRENAHFMSTNPSQVIGKAIIKHGRSNFDFVLLERCDSKQELDAGEIYWIKELNTLVPNGYNRTPGSSTSGMWGKKHSQETKQKMSVAHAGKNNAFFGKKHTPETKQRMREAAKNRSKTIISAETRLKMVQTRKRKGWCKKHRIEGQP